MTTLKENAKGISPVADILKQRGLDTVTQDLHCRIVDYTLHMPLRDYDGHVFAQRVKYFDGSWQFANGQKYGWAAGKKPDHDLWEWFLPLNIKDFIQNANGVCYLANGEPSTLALLTSQVYNTICTTQSEISIPANLVTVLERLGVTELRYLADNDRAGWDSAIKWRDALLDTDISFKAYQWGKELKSHTDDKTGKSYMACVDKPAKYDANDLWIDCGFDIDAMQDAMTNLMVMHLPQPEVKEPIEFDGEFDDTGLAGELRQALSNRFTGRTFQNGTWLQLACPHHDDHQASAGFSHETGVINCFACGSVSPIDTAKLFNIDWRKYLPDKPTPPTKPKTDKPKAQKPERQDHPKIIDTRTYTQVIDDEIMARQMAYEAGQYVSWIQSKDLPVGFISALMNLSGGRSSLAPTFGKMHDALLSGKLKSFFTIGQVVKATGLRRATATKAIQTMLEWGFVRFLRTHSSIYIESIDTRVSKQNDNNPDGGRPCQVFAIESDSDIVHMCLKHMLSVHYEQKHFKRAISVPNHMMAQQIGIDSLADYDTWKKRAESSKQDTSNKAAHEAFRKEMYGDGKDWHGWHYALQSRLTIPIDWSQIHNSKKLRAVILKWWIDNIRPVNSREELQRLLGCSDPVVDSTLAAIDYTSDKQYTDINLTGKDIPQTVAGMRSIFNDNQRQLRGKCFVISYKVKQDEDWKPAKWLQSSDYFNSEHRQPQYLVDFAEKIGRIEEIYLKIITPSMQRPMTEDELQQRQEAEAEQETVTDVTPEPVSDSQQEDDTDDTDSELINIREPNVKSKEYYEFKHLFNQVRLDVHCFTEYTLATDGTLRNTDDEIIKEDLELAEIVAYINSIASDTQLRTVKSFYGDYDEVADIAEIEAYAQERLKRLLKVDMDKPPADIPAQDIAPVQIELPQAAPDTPGVIDMKQSKYYVAERKPPTLEELRSREYWQKKVGA